MERTLRVSEEVYVELEAAVVTQRELLGAAILDSHNEGESEEVDSLIDIYDKIGDVFGLEAFDRSELED